MKVFQVGSEPGRRVTRVDGAWVVCSPTYEFNGDTVAVFGGAVSASGDEVLTPANGVALNSTPDLNQEARDAGAAYRRGYRVVQKWMAHSGAFRVERRFCRGDRDVVTVSQEEYVRLVESVGWPLRGPVYMDQTGGDYSRDRLIPVLVDVLGGDAEMPERPQVSPSGGDPLGLGECDEPGLDGVRLRYQAEILSASWEEVARRLPDARPGELFVIHGSGSRFPSRLLEAFRSNVERAGLTVEEAAEVLEEYERRRDGGS